MDGAAGLHKNIEDLLKKAGSYDQSFSIEAFKRIGNNRTYTINSGGIKYFLKHFFQNEGDLRDRFNVELAFISYAQKSAPGFTPQVLAVEERSKLILYEFIKGSPLKKEDITESEVQQAAAFFRKLNNKELAGIASDLQNASEACFSVINHISLIESRINQLELLTPASEIDRKALKTITRIRKIWDELVIVVHSACELNRLNMERELEPNCKVISPSDFGFHNSLVREDGRIVFLDFEYAGWDDPAKMAGDFFGQIQVPVSQRFFTEFINLTFSDLPNITFLKKRAEILRPLFQIKWACIALNVFLPIHLARRRFSDSEVNIKVLKEEQLVKAENILKYFKTNFNGIY